MPSPFSSVPQLAQLIDCIVNVVCHVSAAEARSDMLLQEEENSSPGEKEKTEFDFGGNDVAADRGFASTMQQQSQQGVNALYQCLLIKCSLSRYCTNHGREPVEQYSESLSLNYLDRWNIF